MDDEIHNIEPVNITITARDIARNMSKEDAQKAILAIDLIQGDCDFTIELLRKLIASLEGDQSREEIAKDLGFKC